MTIAVDLGRKATKPTNKLSGYSFVNGCIYHVTDLCIDITEGHMLLNTSHVEIFSILCIQFVYFWAIHL